MLAGFLDRGGRVVMVGHGHCDWTVSAIRKCLPYVTDCAAVSRHATASFPDPSRVAVIHNGIDTDRCAAVRARQELRSAWGVQPGEIAVGYVGRLSAEKNPLAAVEAAKRLRDRDRESRGLKLTGIGSRRHRAVLVGGGPGTPWILKRARKILRDVIHVPPVENVGDIYRAMDCFVLASPSEGFSLALAEAWHCGCPTVSTPVGATELMEEYGPMGIQVPIGATPEQLAAAVLAAIAEPNRGIVEHAARVVTEHYTAAAMCRRWDEYLTGLRSTR
jgi:glycosyltransferase involved in cell wall biosynthesis